MALDNVTISDIGIKSISNTFGSLSSFLQSSTDAISTFTASMAYWIILLIVIIVALIAMYLFFWVYYKSIVSIIHIYPRFESAIEWIDYNMIERLKRMSENDPLPEPQFDSAPAPDPDVVYMERKQDTK